MADPFLNAVVEVQTELGPEGLLDVCLAVENKLGRVRTGGWSPRTIDIDVLTFGRTSIDSRAFATAASTYRGTRFCIAAAG